MHFQIPLQGNPDLYLNELHNGKRSLYIEKLHWNLSLISLALSTYADSQHKI